MSGPGLDLPASDPRYPVLRAMRPLALLLLAAGLLKALWAGFLLVAMGTGWRPAWVPAPSAWDVLPLTVDGVGAGLTLWGALCMVQLRRWGAALIGSIMLLLPMPPLCILGLPLGLWALVLLNRAPVRAAFEATSAR